LAPLLVQFLDKPWIDYDDHLALRHYGDRLPPHHVVQTQPDAETHHPRNCCIHSASQQGALASVLDDVGWVGQVLVNRFESSRNGSARSAW